MTDARIIPTSGDTSVVTYSILIDGAEISMTIEVLSIVVSHAANRIPSAQLVIRDGDVSLEDFPTSNLDLFVPGKKIDIRIGFASQEKTVFKGIIVKLGIKARSKGCSTLIVECRDAAVKMTIGRHSRFFLKKRDSDVIGELIGKYGLSADVASTQGIHPELVQYHARDWDFVLTRAQANGMLAIVDNGKIAVKPPKTDGAADLSILLGDTIYELDAQLDARHQFQAVTAQGWDYSSQSVVKKSGQRPPESKQGNLTASNLATAIGLQEYELRHIGRPNDEELKTWADAEFVRSSLAKIVGRAQIPGFGGIKVGQLVELGGAGKRFSGLAFVGGVRHEVSDGVWRTDVQFGVSPDNFACRDDICDPPAGGLLPTPHGLQIGVVSALEGDPHGEDRIKVRFPLIDANAEGIWARYACPDAGKDRGICFRPEIGDELIVGFLNQDPRDPVVLGTVHSSTKTAPLPLSNANHEKAIVTRSKLQMHFDDDKKVITIKTPGGNKIVVSDQDQAILLEDSHGNTIKMNSDGITLDASKISLKSKQEITIEAGTDLKAKGTANAELKAGAQVKVEGSAGADFTTSAIATIKGSLVKIN